jgi:mono/diheme cytochrome c family protein
MKHASVKVAVVLVAMFACSYAIAKPLSYELPDETAEFRPGPGVELAQSNCATCHSAEYDSMQPPKMGDAFWLAEVKKMKNTYGAPIEDADIKGIADYLATTY